MGFEGMKSLAVEGTSEAPRGVSRLASKGGPARPIGASIAEVELEAPRGVDLVAPGWGSAGPICASIVVGKPDTPRGVCVAGSGVLICAVVGAVRVLKRTGGVVSSGPGS